MQVCRGYTQKQSFGICLDGCILQQGCASGRKGLLCTCAMGNDETLHLRMGIAGEPLLVERLGAEAMLADENTRLA